MLIRYLGHSFFTLTLENGTVIAMDPYGDFYDYPKRSVKADVCLISHHHFDHDGVSCIQPGAQTIDSAGTHRLDGLTVVSVPTFHDDRQGAQRGSNLIHIVEAEGLRIAHAGDLGHVPDQGQLKQIGHVDVLLLPVGGYYTIDAETALKVCRLLSPVTMIPMHYRTAFNADMPIAELGTFLSLAGAGDSQMPLLRVTGADVCERPEIITLAVQP